MAKGIPGQGEKRIEEGIEHGIQKAQKSRRSVMGTTTAKRALAACSSPNSPAHTMRYPLGSSYSWRFCPVLRRPYCPGRARER